MGQLIIFYFSFWEAACRTKVEQLSFLPLLVTYINDRLASFRKTITAWTCIQDIVKTRTICMCNLLFHMIYYFIRTIPIYICDLLFRMHNLLPYALLLCTYDLLITSFQKFTVANLRQEQFFFIAVIRYHNAINLGCYNAVNLEHYNAKLRH